ncbi:toll/interleukin-1 receptor domain-containing protein (plasmid) [Rhodococcus erythropolis]|uniref:toll/interleukin-1 receptor domain-containing protein n=1 Tax=Rhodococcus erythropolis TaxID=1833 RepID=UPI001F3AB849|nr:toll/interleukin-1 receptor domain-containing protein [Rhodococcus erythropolis]UJC82118.1 toll/interleukin-1 receptor domain-containing protein [Rhodococcus erythropolis]
MTSAAAKHVFISYVRQDNAEVDKLCDLLKAANIAYWRDRESLGPGDAWKRVIREAIQDGTAVFLACFSANQRAKEKSVMNEEIRIAVEEYRLRRPGKTWLVPVRFDDGDIDDWDLGANLSIHDINYADLFGDRYTTEAVKLITMIQDVFGGPTSDPATVQASVEQLSAPERPAKMRELTKSFILDPTKRIELDDLIRSETQRVLIELRSAERFPLQPAAGQADNDADLLIADLATDYWRLIEPLCWSLQVAARYADTVEQLTPWIRALTALHTYTVEPVGGRTVLIKLRYVPLLACVVTAAVATAGDDRWDNFRRLLVDCTVKPRHGDTRVESIAEAVDFYAPFAEAGKAAPSALAYAAESEKYTLESALAALRTNGIQHRLQPVADWLCAMLCPMFADQFTDNDSYENAFDRAEVMLGLVTQDSISMLVERNPELSWLRGTHWFGRSTWRHKHSNSSPVNEFAQQLDTAGADYGPLKAGLFGSQQERAGAAMTSYAEQFAKVSRGYW